MLRTIMLMLVVLALPVSLAAQSASPPAAAVGIVRGVVLDRLGGSPISDVSVQLQDTRQVVTTDANGRFELNQVQPGSRTLFVSIVGFILVKRTVQVAAGQSLDVTVVLSEGTGTYTETVVVTSERFREQEKAVPAQLVLGSADIQNLRSLVTNDPMRTIQVLPGVSTGDDFRSEFAVRGSPFSKIAFTLDGIPASFLLHTVAQVQDGGSIAMVNGDILDGISLMNGSYPQRYGNRLGAELDFHMREGSRDRRQVRAGVSGTDASFVAEGPMGADKSGSWLVSVRKSYLEYLLKRISEDDDEFGFGFSDAQAKFVKDLSSRHHLEVSLVAGRSRLDSGSDFNDPEEVTDGRNAAQLFNVGWRFTPSASIALTQRFAVAANQFNNMNLDGVTLGDGGGREVTWRADATAVRSRTMSIETGGQVQWLQRRDARGRIDLSPVLFYDGSAVHASGYAQMQWSPTSRLTVIPGARVDRWSLTSDAGVSPWLQVAWKLRPSVTLRAGGGIHRQFPGIDAVTGPIGNPDLVPERAYHADVGVEQTFGSSRWQLTLYDREERDALRRSFAEFQLVDDDEFPVQYPGHSPALWVNSLDGHARGVELLVQRRSTSGLSGWLSYSFGINKYRDRQTGETFYGDFDQRHTVNAYGVLRLSNRASLAVKWRAGSNFPIPGYWEQRGTRYFLIDRRNTARVPIYSRLDVRINRTFHLQGKRMTLFAEVLNLLGRENVRFRNPLVDTTSFEVYGLFQNMIPRVPSAGLLIEF